MQGLHHVDHENHVDHVDHVDQSVDHEKLLLEIQLDTLYLKHRYCSSCFNFFLAQSKTFQTDTYCKKLGKC